MTKSLELPDMTIHEAPNFLKKGQIKPRLMAKSILKLKSTRPLRVI